LALEKTIYIKISIPIAILKYPNIDTHKNIWNTK
jgi:hypothetical protein